jgi:dihydroorotate dehydrogenase electron transfer subunit
MTIRQMQAVLSQRRLIAPALWEIELSVPAPCETVCAGQCFLMAGPTYLRRALYPANVAPQRMTFLIKAASDPLVAWLIGRAPGDVLDLIGPLGHGFELPSQASRLLLVAETAPDVGPLLQLLTTGLANGAEIMLVTGGTHAAAVYPVSELPPAVEVHIATTDGSLGRRGSVANLLPDVLAWADRVYAVGSRSLYRAIHQAVCQVRPVHTANFVQVLLNDVALLCGAGTCCACTVETSAGWRHVCTDGPVFPLERVIAS